LVHDDILSQIPMTDFRRIQSRRPQLIPQFTWPAPLEMPPKYTKIVC